MKQSSVLSNYIENFVSNFIKKTKKLKKFSSHSKLKIIPKRNSIEMKTKSNRVWVAQGQSREATIKNFEESNYPITLIGAGIKDGVDFKGDKCRYQILFKVPYPNLGSQQVKVRKQTDPIWYLNQTVQPLQQAYGRGIRDADDYCKMYILDEDFEHLVSKYNCLFNEYFLEGIQ